MNRLLERDWVLKLLALLLAIGLWLGVHPGGLPLGRRVLLLPLRTVGAEPGRSIRAVPKTVRVTVLAPSSLLPSLVGRVRAAVSLAGVGSGRHFLPIRVGAPAGVRVLGIDPPRVMVAVERRPGRLLTVRPIPSPPLPPGLGIEDLAVRPDRVVVYGEARTLSGLRLVAEYRPPSRPGRFSQAVRLRPEDAAGEDAQGVSLPRPAVTVSGTVYLLPSLLLPIRVVTEGRPAAGFAVSGISVAPDRLAVKPGRAGLPKSLVTLPVSLDGRSRDFRATTAVLLPEGVSPLGETSVTVRVELAQQGGP